MTVTLIISTYNRPDALRLCLLSVFNQTVMPDEVLIGDDGSREDTKLLIDSLRPLCPVSLKHIWHEDKGFRLAMMRNKCVATAIGDYIIEIDGDVILHHDFVKDHVSFAKCGYYIKGGRTNIGRKLTDKLCLKGVLRPLNFLTRGIESKPENALHLPAIARLISSHYRKNRETALGCNMSFFKDDFIAINGYDEFFEGWGGEDGDIGSRFQAYGLKKCHLKFAGIIFHLWHEDKYMYNKDKNCEYSKRTDKPTRCNNGVDKYLIQQ